MILQLPQTYFLNKKIILFIFFSLKSPCVVYLYYHVNCTQFLINFLFLFDFLLIFFHVNCGSRHGFNVNCHLFPYCCKASCLLQSYWSRIYGIFSFLFISYKHSHFWFLSFSPWQSWDSPGIVTVFVTKTLLRLWSW